MDEKQIRKKIDILLKVGASFGWEVKPTVKEEELKIFENKFNVKIPENYRWFVLNIANGILSEYPYLQVTSEIDFANYFYEEDGYNPAIPFDISARVRFVPETTEDDYDFPFKTQFDPDHTLFYNIFNGWIDVGIEELLIVNGPEYGNMWQLDYSSNSEIRPMYNKFKIIERIGFSEWVEDKLDNYINMDQQG